MKKQFIIKIGLVLFLLSVFLPSAVSAQADLQKPELLVPLGDFSEFKDIDKRQCIGPDYKEGDQCYYIPWIAQYVQAAYKYGLILGSVLAVTIFVISGGLYLTSGLNPSLQQKAKGYMTGAVLGLTLLLGAYMVLRFINPDLIALRPLEVQVLKRKEIPDPFCSNVAKSEYFRVERLADEREAVTSNAAEYSSGGDKYMRCGVKYNVAVREQHRKNISMPVGQTCFGDVCEAKKYCKDFGGSARCVPAVLYGEIKKASRFNESVLSHSSITETFADSLEIDKSRFSLIHNDVGFWSNSEKLQSVDNTYLPQN
ncbi:hypothetical protein HN958_01130, partial [Candidatus Falkowbacteria bacterium]|nr:hypothetical protein [Candidatus Falkowbacteria bacterium]